MVAGGGGGVKELVHTPSFSHKRNSTKRILLMRGGGGEEGRSRVWVGKGNSFSVTLGLRNKQADGLEKKLLYESYRSISAYQSYCCILSSTV